MAVLLINLWATPLKVSLSPRYQPAWRLHSPIVARRTPRMYWTQLRCDTETRYSVPYTLYTVFSVHLATLDTCWWWLCAAVDTLYSFDKNTCIRSERFCSKHCKYRLRCPYAFMCSFHPSYSESFQILQFHGNVPTSYVTRTSYES